MTYEVNPNIVLITVGRGGTTLYHGRSKGVRNCRVETYGERWREYLDGSNPTTVIPDRTPVVDCTVPECDIFAHAVSGPMFCETLDADQVHELGAPPFVWGGKKASGMATVGLDVYLAHAAFHGCKITDARTGEPWPAPELLPDNTVNSKAIALAMAVAADPARTIASAMIHGIDNAVDRSGDVTMCDECNEDVPDREMPDGSLLCAYCAGE